MLEKKIASARSDGFTDDEIISVLKDDPKVGAKVQSALADNFSASEILNVLAPDKSFISAFQKGGADVVEGAGRTAKQIGQGFDIGAVDKGGKFVQDVGASFKPKNYRTGMDEFLTPTEDEKGFGGFGWSGIPRAAAEGAPMLGAALLTRNPVAAALLYGLTSYGGNVEQTMRNNNRDPEKEKATGRDMLQGGLTTAGEAALGGYGVGKIAGPLKGGVGQGVKQFGKAVGLEGAIGAGQDTIGQIGTSIGTEQGVSFDPRQAFGAGLTNATTAVGLKAPALARNALTNLQLSDVDNSGNQATYAANLVRRVVDEHPTLDVNNPRDVGPILQEALKFNNGRISEALKSVKDDLVARNLNDAATALDGLRENADTLSLIKNAKTKTGAAVGPEAIKRIESLVGDTANGQMLIDALKAQAALKTVNSQIRKVGDKYIGGVAASMPLLEKLASAKALSALGVGGTALGMGLSNVPFASAATAAIAANPLAAIGAASVLPGVYLGARGIDALTGSRNPLDRFMNRFEDPAQGTMRDSNAPSKQQQKEAEALKRRAILQQQMDELLNKSKTTDDEPRVKANADAVTNADVIVQRRQNFLSFKTLMEGLDPEKGPQIVEALRFLDGRENHVTPGLEALKAVREQFGDLGQQAHDWWVEPTKKNIKDTRVGRMFFSQKLGRMIETPDDAVKSRGL